MRRTLKQVDGLGKEGIHLSYDLGAVGDRVEEQRSELGINEIVQISRQSGEARQRSRDAALVKEAGGIVFLAGIVGTQNVAGAQRSRLSQERAQVAQQRSALKDA